MTTLQRFDLDAERATRAQRLETFCAAWEKHFRAQVVAHPEQYAAHPKQYAWLIVRMRTAIARGSYNKDSASFRLACKELGIKHTYKAITSYLEG